MFLFICFLSVFCVYACLYVYIFTICVSIFKLFKIKIALHNFMSYFHLIFQCCLTFLIIITFCVFYLIQIPSHLLLLGLFSTSLFLNLISEGHTQHLQEKQQLHLTLGHWQQSRRTYLDKKAKMKQWHTHCTSYMRMGRLSLRMLVCYTGKLRR